MRRFCLVLTICCVFLCSCTLDLQTESQENTTTSLSEEKITNMITTEIGDSLVVIDEESEKVIFTDERFPIMKDGEICGWGQINFIEKLGIWDWYNKTALQNGVKVSYAINFQIDMNNYLENNEFLSIACDPYLEINGEITGEPCNIGWSGFGAIAELYNKNRSDIIEVTVQPYTDSLAEDEILRLDFHSADETVIFDSVYIATELLENAIEGPDILTIDDTKTIESINGAKYTIKFSDIFREIHDTDETGNIERGSYWYYDFIYQIHYDSGPVNSREVLSFDSFSNYNYVVPLKVQVTSDVDDTALNESVFTAERLLYSDTTDTELYCTPFSESVPVGDTVKVQNNRMIPASTKTDATYLRFVIEFTEEQGARSSEELKDFNGRYVVWQVPFNIRELEEMPR